MVDAVGSARGNHHDQDADVRPYLSLIVPTMRMGGLDVLLSGLAQQTFRDFELVLVDGVKPWRNAPELEQFDFVRHIEPTNNPFPIQAFSAYANTGLLAARGEIVMFSADYTWYPPLCLERHAAHHVACPDPGWGYMAPHQYVECPTRAPGLPEYTCADMDVPTGTPEQLAGYQVDAVQYLDDMKRGRFYPFGWSTFAESFSGDARTLPPAGRGRANADVKLRTPAGGVPPSYFHAQNESVKRERAIQAGGWCSAMNGSGGWEDTEFAERVGCAWHNDPENVSWVLTPERMFPKCKLLRPHRSNEALCGVERALEHRLPLHLQTPWRVPE